MIKNKSNLFFRKQRDATFQVVVPTFQNKGKKLRIRN